MQRARAVYDYLWEVVSPRIGCAVSVELRWRGPARTRIGRIEYVSIRASAGKILPRCPNSMQCAAAVLDYLGVGVDPLIGEGICVQQ